MNFRVVVIGREVVLVGCKKKKKKKAEAKVGWFDKFSRWVGDGSACSTSRLQIQNPMCFLGLKTLVPSMFIITNNNFHLPSSYYHITIPFLCQYILSNLIIISSYHGTTFSYEWRHQGSLFYFELVKYQSFLLVHPTWPTPLREA